MFNSNQSNEESDTRHIFATAVKELMLRHGVNERQFSKTLSTILRLSYSQAHRKMGGDVDWTVSELKQIAEHFGESLSTVGFGGDEDTESIAYRGTLVLHGGEYHFPCLVWVGEPLASNAKVDFVATRNGEEWVVFEASKCPEKTARLRVNKLELVVTQPPAPTIAIVDDEQGFADNLCEYLNDSGFQAQAFYNPISLERAMEDQAFDGYVIDWILGDRTAEQLIRKIRLSATQDVPIYLLTGEVATGLVDESEAARVIKQLGVQWKEKPIRLATFAAELQKSLGV